MSPRRADMLRRLSGPLLVSLCGLTLCAPASAQDTHGHAENAHGHAENAHGHAENAHGHSHDGHNHDAHSHAEDAHGHSHDGHNHDAHSHAEDGHNHNAHSHAEDAHGHTRGGHYAGDGHIHHHKNELGVVNAPVYFVREGSLNYGLHIHYLRSVGDAGLAIGVGYERIFDRHGHQTIGPVFAYRLFDALGLSLTPGVTFEDGEWDRPGWAVHIEAVYEFELGPLHIGPALELAFDAEDIHISPGLHVGIGF